MNDHIEEISIAAQVAVRTLLSTGNLRRVDQKSEHATIVAYYVDKIVRVDIKPRED